MPPRHNIRHYIFISLIALSAILVLIIRINPSIIIPKTKGSFEYVRRGEDLLEKKQFTRAIAEFEKAYGISPDNEDVQSNLIYGYTEYARSIGSKDYDKALEYLKKAAAIRLDEYTAQNFAVMQTDAAFEAAKSGRRALALEGFGLSREAVDGFTRAAKNLSVWLFNKGVEARNAHNDELAILCVKESLLINEEPLAFEFLADLYYGSNDFDGAIFYYKRSLASLNEPRVAEKLSKVEREAAISSSLKRASSPHFEFRYEEGLIVDTSVVTDVIEKAYESVGKALDLFLKDATTVYIYSEKNFRRIFKLPDMVRAFYDGNIRMPYPDGVKEKEALRQYLFHEFTHAVVSAKTENRCPEWFNEGLAVWQQAGKIMPEGVIPALNEMVESDVSLADLDAAFKGEASGDIAKYYLYSYSVVLFIIDEWGEVAIRKLLDRIKNGQHIINAIDDQFLMSEREFEGRWRSYASSKLIPAFRSVAAFPGDE